MTTAPNSIDVGEYFIHRYMDEKDEYPSLMQILKLTYIAQGFHLALNETGEPFFQEVFKAWEHGPVEEELYRHLKKRCGGSSYFIEKEDRERLHKANEKFSSEQKKILHVVFKKYSKLSAWSLSALTHRDGTPWTETHDTNGNGAEISTELIKSHFKQIINPLSFDILLSEY